MKYYVRFGPWPEDERSQIFTDEGYKTPLYEKGVNAFRAKKDKKKDRWNLYQDGGFDSFYPNMEELFSGDRLIYLITGDEVGVGADGGPVLRNIKIIKQLSLSDLYNEEIYNIEEIIESEEPPLIEIKSVDIVFKEPHTPPEILNIKINRESISELLNSEYYEYQAIGGGYYIISPDLSYCEDCYDLNLMLDDSPVFGNVIILRMISPDSLEFSKKLKGYNIKWPWNLLVENGEIFGNLSDLEYSSIKSEHRSKIIDLLNNEVR